MKTCTICNDKLYNETYCQTCTLLLGSLYHKYTIQQVMAIFSQVIGTKITQSLTDTMMNALRDSYIVDNLKKEDKLN